MMVMVTEVGIKVIIMILMMMVMTVVTDDDEDDTDGDIWWLEYYLHCVANGNKQRFCLCNKLTQQTMI